MLRQLLCLIGWHEWGREESQRIEPQIIRMPHVTIDMLGRTFWFHECKHCGRWVQFYKWAKSGSLKAKR
jgi:hypothetical protein